MKHIVVLLSLFLAPLASSGQLAAVGQVDEDLRFQEEVTSFNAQLSKEEVEANDRERRRITEHRKTMRERIGTLNQANKTLSARLEKSRESLAKAQALHHEESAILKDTQANNDRLMAANKTIDQELNTQERLILQQRDQVTALRRQIADAERNQANLLKRQDQLKKDLIEQRRILQKLRAQREGLERENQDLSADVKRLESVNREVGQRLSRLD